MIRQLVVRPDAEAEITDAAIYYNDRAAILRERFLDEVDAALERIRQNPNQYQRVYRDARRAILGRFPYALIYVASDDETTVFACFHGSRDAKVWQERITK
jgi:plasmid stabilization system protein ParE